MFETVGKVDAVVCISGDAKWAEFSSLTEEDFYIGVKSKLMGQGTGEIIRMYDNC